MAINHRGELTSAIPDFCKNYDPSDKLSGVVSEKNGNLYECLMLDCRENNPSGCLWCTNQTDEKGELVNMDLRKYIK